MPSSARGINIDKTSCKLNHLQTVYVDSVALKFDFRLKNQTETGKFMCPLLWLVGFCRSKRKSFFRKKSDFIITEYTCITHGITSLLGLRPPPFQSQINLRNLQLLWACMHRDMNSENSDLSLDDFGITD